MCRVEQRALRVIGRGGNVGGQSPLMRVQENQQIAPLPCCFGDEAQVVRNMVIYSLMLPAILGCRYIPM
jgi:hypothetical protein